MSGWSRRGVLAGASFLPLAAASGGDAQGAEDAITLLLQQNRYSLEDDGFAFLLAEAGHAAYFLLGELHGDNEIPALLHRLWPELWARTYRHMAAELSPWRAARMASGQETPSRSLWSLEEARFIASFAPDALCGCDMEEFRPDLMVEELSRRNPASPALAAMAGRGHYTRADASDMREAFSRIGEIADVNAGGISLREQIRATLDVETIRALRSTKPQTAYQASQRREAVMKTFFTAHFRGSDFKVMARFGRNHMHRGIDRRGIATLGNFIAEYAAGKGQTCFNLACFATGGEVHIDQNTIAWDERGDDPVFAYLAGLNDEGSAGIFDLRPLRPLLHTQPASSPLLAGLRYWADSYDAVLHYPRVTPRP